MVGIGSEQNEGAGARGIGGGKQHAHRAALGLPEQRGALGSGCIHDGTDIVHAVF